MFPLVSKKLARRVQNVITIGSHAVNVIDRFRKSTVVIATGILFHEFFKAVLIQLLVFHVKVFVLFHVCFVLKSELAAGAVTMKVRGFLTAEWAIVSRTILASSKPSKLKSFFRLIAFKSLSEITDVKTVFVFKDIDRNR